MTEKCDVCDVELVWWWNPTEAGYGSQSCPKCKHIFAMVNAPYIPLSVRYKSRNPLSERSKIFIDKDQSDDMISEGAPVSNKDV